MFENFMECKKGRNNGNYIYEGYWDNNKINGQGTNTIYNDDGSYTINTGEWKDNKLYTGTSTVYNKDNSVRSTTKYVNGVKS